MLKETVLRVINEVWKMGKIPPDWGKTIIVPIYKGKGDTRVCDNYKGISLINHVTKLYERIIENRTRALIEDRLGEEQFGYREDRSTSDPVFIFRMVIEKCWEFNKDLHVTFIDLSKAFDSIPRKKLC